MDNSIEIPLNLPDVRVQAVNKTTKGEWLIRLRDGERTPLRPQRPTAI